LRPLLRLLGLCAAAPATPALQASLVLLLSQLCVCVAREPGLLERFFYRPPGPGTDPGSGPADLLLFSLLVPFVHHEGITGQQARDALLLIMAMSASNCTVASYITDHSYFCPVLATGLSALYSSLPRKIEVRGDDWHFLRREDWAGVASLALFMNSLEFCSAVIQVAHPLVQQQLVDYVHNGFLVPVMGPALHKTSVEEMIASTAYLELFVRSVAEPALLRAFLRFILLHRHDGATILDTLVARLGTNSRLCMVSLSLFRTLLSLNCEDVMLQLVLRYLIPCSHVMLSQRRAVKDLDLYGRSAAKFLSLIPRCCHPESLPLPERDEEHAAWAKGHGSPSVDTSSVVTVPKPATPSRLSFFMRQQSAGGAEGLGAVPRSPGLASPASSPGHRPARWEEVAELDGNYLEYLRDARLSVDRCAWACRVWSAPYDGERPGPDSLVPTPAPALPISPDHFGHGPPTPRTKKRGLPEEAGGSAAGPGDSRPLPAPDARDPGALVNGAAELGRPGGGPEGAVTVKKVRRCPQAEREALPAENGAPQPPAPGWEGPSVDSLLDELLARAPAEPNGAGLSIESFSEELQELEAAMRNGGGGPPRAQLPPPHAEEDEAEDEDEAFAAPPRPADPLAQVLASPPRALGPPPSQPFTGPFVAVLFSKLENMLHNSLYVNVLLTGLVAQLACYPQPLLRSFLLNANMVFQPSVKSLLQVPPAGPFVAVLFSKLENMLHNSLYVNVLLTGLVAQLACYPQPLLRSFLLNANMVFQPSVKSLLQVLGSVKNKIESFAAGQDDFPALLLKAKKYLIARGKLDWGDTPNAAPALRRSDTLVKSRKPSLGELLLRHTQSPTRARAAAQLALQQVREGPVLQVLAGAGLFRGAAEKQGEALRVKNAVYCAVVFTEFLKELAAIAQAHAVTSPFLLEPPEE
ncbi:PREDICTED: FTS and Hook-interacting protein, partial [Gavialis gangeticus]|uniref:FTS and Hook-interacting protein n=1 Tax=Gavialis gangeticus TaxID=94835 RepID=UPI00092EEAEE